MFFRKCACMLLLFVFAFMIIAPTAYAAVATDTAMEILFVENDSQIRFSDAVYRDGVITVRGSTGEGAGGGVSMRAFDSVSGETIGIDQTAADLHCNFVMAFAPGTHKRISLAIAGKDTGVAYMAVVLSDNSAADRIQMLTESLQMCENLFAQCRQKGISTDYETLYYNLIQRSVEIMAEQAGANRDLQVAEYNIPIAYQYLNVILNNLRAYLSGEKTPLSVPLVQPDNIAFSGKSFVGTVIENGQTKTQPIYLNGYCLGFDDRDETESLLSLGQNVTGEVLAFDDVIGKIGYPAGWKLNPGSAGYPDADYWVTTEEKSSGETALKIVNRSTAAENRKGYLWQKFVLEPNTSYRFGGKYKGNASNVTVNFGFGNTVATISENTSRWKNFDITYRIPATQSGEMVVLIALNDVAEGLYLDDFYLYEGGSNVNLLKNPGFEYTFTACADEEFGVSMGMIQEFKNKLDRYYDNGVSIILDPQLYGIRSYLDKYPLAREQSKDNYSGHLPYNITHPRVLELSKLYFDSVLPVLNDCKNLKAVQVTNEPSFRTDQSEFYAPQWSQWLKNKYQDISALNNVYSTSYSSFDAVPMNTDYTLKNASYNDWREFNASIMTEYNMKISEYIHNNALNLWVMTKVMMYTACYEQTRFLNGGTNYEDMSKAFDVNGNDAWTYLGTRDTIFGTNMWYDLQSSVLQRPVFNLENHVILDDPSIKYDRNYAAHYRSAVWQGALHGLGGSMAWLWGKSDHMDDGEFRNTTMQYRLDCMIEGGKLTYDLNRLADRVSALANKEPDVAILYSYTDPVYNRAHEEQVTAVYKDLLCKGMKPIFITEEDFSNLEKCEVLIVAYAQHVPESTLDKTIEAIRKGKKVILFGEDCLAYNDNNQSQPAEKLTALNAGAEAYPLEARSEMTENVNLLYNSSKVTVTQQRGVMDNVEVSSVRMGDKVIINLCNYDEETPQTVSIKYDGKEIGRGVDLINGATYDMANIELHPLTPVMLEFELNCIVFQEKDNEVIATAICNDPPTAGTEAVLHVAAYDLQGRLLNIASDTEKLLDTGAEFSAYISAEYLKSGGYLKAFLWETGSLSPIATAQIFRKE